MTLTRPTLIAEIAFASDPTASSPTWTDVTDYVRDWSVTHGRSSRLDLVDTAALNVTLDNRDRRFDPTLTTGPYGSNIKVMRRIRLRATHSGTTYPIFDGYIDAWPQKWTEAGRDAEVELTASDAFKPLSYFRLPVTDPPFDTFDGLKLFDKPHVYFPFSDVQGHEAVDLANGHTLTYASAEVSPTFGQTGTITGESDTAALFTAANSETGAFEGGNLRLPGKTRSWFTIDFFYKPATIGAVHGLARGPNTGGGNYQWAIGLTATGALSFSLRTAAGVKTVTETTLMSAGTWYRCRIKNTFRFSAPTTDDTLSIDVSPVGDITGTEVTLNYTRSTPEAPTAAVPLTAIGDQGTQFMNGTLQKFAIYNHALTSLREDAHDLAALLGFNQQLTGTRVGAILDLVGGWAAGLRNVQAGQRNILPTRQYGQTALEELRVAEEADSGLLFIAKDGKVTFLDRDWKTRAPYSTSQATFGSDTAAGEVPYTNVSVTRDDSFLYNQVFVTAENGELQTAEDATSQAAYLVRTYEKSGVRVTNDTDALEIADDLLAALKDPLDRVESLDLVYNPLRPAVGTQMLLREIGDHITVKVRPRAGGTAISQASHIEQITLGADRAQTWTATFAISPR